MISHFLVDRSVSGSRRGVGAGVRMRVKKPGSAGWLEIEAVAALDFDRNEPQPDEEEKR